MNNRTQIEAVDSPKRHIRGRFLPRSAGVLLAVGCVLGLVAALFPPEYQAKVAVPVGLALAWLGYALWSERRAPASKLAPCEESPLLSQPVAA